MPPCPPRAAPGGPSSPSSLRPYVPRSPQSEIHNSRRPRPQNPLQRMRAHQGVSPCPASGLAISVQLEGDMSRLPASLAAIVAVAVACLSVSNSSGQIKSEAPTSAGARPDANGPFDHAGLPKDAKSSRDNLAPRDDSAPHYSAAPLLDSP